MKAPDQACQQCREAIRLEACGALTAEQQSAVEQHLAECVECRAYSRKLRLMTGGMRDLSAQPVEPSPNFRARWTSAITESNQPGPLAQALAAWIEWSRQMVLRNRRVLATLTPVWILILVFKFITPDVGSVPPTTMARSPVEIFLALKVEGNALAAFDRRNREPAPLKAPAVAPRSDQTPTRRTTRRDSETTPETLFLT